MEVKYGTRKETGKDCPGIDEICHKSPIQHTFLLLHGITD